MVQGLGQRRGACSEFSPGIPFMWRKVEMRLACTATRLPPTPAETEDLRHGGRDESPGGEGDMEKKDKDSPLPSFLSLPILLYSPLWRCGRLMHVQEGTQADLWTQGA